MQSAVVRETSGAGRTSRHEQLTPTAHQATSANLQWDLWCRAGLVPSLSDTPCVSDCEIRMSSGSPYHRKPCPAIESREHLKTEDAVVSDRRVPAFTLYSCEKCLRTCISQFGVRRLVTCRRFSFARIARHKQKRRQVRQVSALQSRCIRHDFEVKTNL